MGEPYPDGTAVIVQHTDHDPDFRSGDLATVADRAYFVDGQYVYGLDTPPVDPVGVQWCYTVRAEDGREGIFTHSEIDPA